MQYLEFKPALALQRYVECFWTISSFGEPAPSNAGTILPDGGVELVLNFADAVKRRHDDDRDDNLLQRMIVGQLPRWSSIEYTGKADLLGIRFHPAGAYAFFRLPQHEMSGQILRLDDVAGRLDRQLAGRLDPAWPFCQRIATLEQLLLEHLGNTPTQDQVVEAAVLAMQRTHGRVPVSALLSDLAISRRQFERRFMRVVGLNPKMLCRVLRFRRAWQAIEQLGLRDWSALAQQCGYYDQSHLIRDFQQFAGETPARVVATRER